VQIYLDKRTVRQIRLSALDAIEEGDLDTLREDLYNAFSDADIEEIDLRVDSGEFLELLQDILDEWSGDDVDELMDLLETELSDIEVELRYESDNPDADDDDDEDEDEDEEDGVIHEEFVDDEELV